MIKHLLYLMAVPLLALLTLAPAAAEERPLIAFGDPFPELVLTLSGPDHDLSYLGLGGNASFTPSQVRAELLLVELLNVHCIHCQQQAPSYNELFKLIETTPATRGRIKLLGIAVGNLPEEVEAFRRAYQVPFPIVADPRFAAHRALGGSATPFSIYVRQDSSGQSGVVAKTHLGLNADIQKVFTELAQLADADSAALRSQGAAAVRTRTAITPLYSDQQLAERVQQAFRKTGGELIAFGPVELRSGRRVYTAVMRRGEQSGRLFAEVASRQTVCDICHDVHFIYVFDMTTRIVGFEPLQVTKYGNVLWNDEDVTTMRRRVVGQYLTAPRPFDPKVDAVTSATISSAIIFDSLAQGEALIEELRAWGN
jgi:hypothetical protein